MILKKAEKKKMSFDEHNKILICIVAGVSFGFWQGNFHAGVHMTCLLILVHMIGKESM